MDEKTKEAFDVLGQVCEAFLAADEALSDVSAEEFCRLLTITEWGFDSLDRHRAEKALAAFIRKAARSGNVGDIMLGCLKYAEQGPHY